MKKYKQILCILTLMFVSLCASAQNNVVEVVLNVVKKDSIILSHNADEINNIEWNEATNEHEYVDLGLSVKWATCNVGAYSPEQFGDYYAWGETETKPIYNWDSYKFKEYITEDLLIMTKYWDHSFVEADGKNTLEPEDDVAHVKWGGNWRMPTYTEMVELVRGCKWDVATRNGVNGIQVTGKNGKTIFFPCAGARYETYISGINNTCLYWTSKLYHESDPSYGDDTYLYSYDAYRIMFSSLDDRSWYRSFRYVGLPVRPVCP